MAEINPAATATATNTTGTVSKPATATKAAPQTKGPALDHLVAKGEKGVLTPIKDYEARTAELAVRAFIDAPPSSYKKLAEAVASGKEVVVVVPDRNYTEVGAEEEVKRTLKIKARK